MVVRVGVCLSVLVVVVGVAVALLGPGRTPDDLDYIYPVWALVLSALALAVIWIGVLVASVVVNLSRSTRRARGAP